MCHKLVAWCGKDVKILHKYAAKHRICCYWSDHGTHSSAEWCDFRDTLQIRGYIVPSLAQLVFLVLRLFHLYWHPLHKHAKKGSIKRPYYTKIYSNSVIKLINACWLQGYDGKILLVTRWSKDTYIFNKLSIGQHQEVVHCILNLGIHSLLQTRQRCFN